MQVRAINQSVKEKKNLIRELCYRGEEKHGEKKEERQLERERERDLWEDEKPELVTMRVWGEKKQREERKSEKTYHEREKAPKNYVSHDYKRR